LHSTAPLEQQLDIQAIAQATVDHERLRYVTRLLGSQQGLNTALLGTLLFWMNVPDALDCGSGWWKQLAWLVGLVGLTIYFVAGQRWIPEYYQRRFGSVQAARVPSSKWDALFFLAILVLLFVVIFIGQPINHYLDPVVSRLVSRLHTMISDPERQINLWPSLLWMWLFFSSMRWHIPSIERQRSFFLLGGLVAFPLIAIYGILHPDARQVWLWKVLNAGGVGLSLVVMGLYDHIILIRTLPKRAAEGDDE